MCHRPTVVIERIARPDAAVRVVECVVVGVEVALLPCQVSRDDGPHPSGIVQVARPAEVPQQLVHVAEVHVVVVHLVVPSRVAADVAVAVHLRAPLLCSACQVHRAVLRGVGIAWQNVSDLRGGIVVEVCAGAVGPSQAVARIGSPPSAQGHPPSVGTVQPDLTVPDAVGSCHECTAQGVDEGVGRLDAEAGYQCLACSFRLLVELPSACRGEAAQLPVGVEHVGDARLVGGESRGRGRLCQGSLEAVGRVGTHVAVAAEPFGTDGGEASLEAAVLRTFKAPDGFFAVRQRKDRDTEAVRAPCRVGKHVAASSGRIACLAVGGGVQGKPLPSVARQAEGNVPALGLVVDSKDGAVAGLHPVGGMAAIEGTGVAVLSVDADEVFPVRHILQPPGRPPIGIVVGGRFGVVPSFECRFLACRLCRERQCGAERTDKSDRLLQIHVYIING